MSMPLAECTKEAGSPPQLPEPSRVPAAYAVSDSYVLTESILQRLG